MSREQRKLDHIKYALKLGDGPQTSGLEHVHFVHNCLPELNPQDKSTAVWRRPQKKQARRWQ